MVANFWANTILMVRGEVILGKVSSGSHREGYFNGTIDEVKIYNHVLSEEEMPAYYEAGLSPTTNSLSGIVTTPYCTDIANPTGYLSYPVW